MKLDHYTEADLDKAKAERSAALARRADVVSWNRSRNLRGVPQEALPPKPDNVLVPCAYDADGGWHGRLYDTDECPDGCVIKWEKA